ncbi:MAG TPA: PLDc N-terminal domain-containing protein [Microbacterium sp.]|nr:PLDc N-terminal domain-containing protein [Microbacterium sp.]
MGDAVNPLLPAAYDIAWTVAAVLSAMLAVVALVSITRHARLLTWTAAVVWTLLVILVPVIGSLAWLSVGRRARAERASVTAGG